MESMDLADTPAIAADTAAAVPGAPFELAGRPYWCPVNLAIDALTGRW